MIDRQNRRSISDATAALMDCSSGVSKQRQEQIRREAGETLLGDAINFPFPEGCDVWGNPDLGDSYRSQVKSTVPTLLISGTLDGFTPVSNGEEVAKGLSNSVHVIIERPPPLSMRSWRNMTSQTILKAMLPPLILVGAFYAPDRAPAQPPSQAPGQVQGKPVSLTGKIEIKALPGPGAWMNTPKDFKILSEDSFSITATTKTDLYNDVSSGVHTATAPMLLFPAEDTFILTTAVTVDFKQEYDGGFLVVYSDPDHWMKLLFEKSHYGPFSVCSNVTNVNSDGSVNADVPGKEVFLRLTRAKDVFGFYYSIDGTKWTYIRYFRFPLKGPAYVGFGSQSPIGEQCKTVFSKIRYSPKAVGDFWTGEPK